MRKKIDEGYIVKMNHKFKDCSISTEFVVKTDMNEDDIEHCLNRVRDCERALHLYVGNYTEEYLNDENGKG